MPIEIETIAGRDGANFFVSRKREIVFVSGRMGCGKTTWIREQIARDEAQGLRCRHEIGGHLSKEEESDLEFEITLGLVDKIYVECSPEGV